MGELLAAGGRGPMRPAHVHFMVTADGYERLITHVFAAGDEYLDSDVASATKPELTLDPQPTGNGDEIRSDYDFVLEPERS